MIDYTNLLPGHWRPIEKPELGAMYALSQSISRAEASEPDLLPNLRSTDTLFVLSDFSGSHKTSPYESFAFLLADPGSFRVWQNRWKLHRARHLVDGRRMAFKSLHDKRRRRTLIPFLQAANQLHGLLVIVLVPKSFESLFKDKGRLKMADESLSEFSHWDAAAFERLLRAVHLVSFFLGGLSAPSQDIFWYTDEDDIAPNDSRLYDVCEVYKRVSGHYFSHMMGHFRFGTSRSDDGTRILEDLLSVPDLAAGCMTEIMERYRSSGVELTDRLLVPPPNTLTYKSRLLADWLGFTHSPLRRLIYAVEPVQPSPAVVWRRVQFFRHDA